MTRDTADGVARHLAVGSWRESRRPQEKITLAYKLRWRWVELLKRLLGKKYTVIRLY